MKENFDFLNAEKNEADILIDRGFFFEVPKKSLLRWFSKKKTRRFEIQQPYLGVLDMINRIFLDIEFNEKEITENPLTETKKLVIHSRKLAEVIAIVILGSKWKIRLFAKVLGRYFLWRITPDNLLQITLGISQMSNLENFIVSIRLMSRIRTTAPKPIEEKQPD